MILIRATSTSIRAFALAVAAGRDDFCDVPGDLSQGCGRRRAGYCRDLVGELVSAGAQLCCPGFELGEPVGEVFRIERAVLERGQVPVDRCTRFGQFVLGGGQFCARAVLRGGVAGLRLKFSMDFRSCRRRPRAT
jgi:hypothetical protein